MAGSRISSIGVIGAGAWGTTLANLLAEKGYGVSLWVREEEVFHQIKEKGINETFLPETKLHPQLEPVRTFREALKGKDLVLMVVPSHVFRDVFQEVKSHVPEGAPIVTATKGIENDTLMTMSQVIRSVFPRCSESRLACLAGPSFAKEVSMKRPTAVTIACKDMKRAEKIQHTFYTEFFRVYTTEDVIGVELCGALKNVIAIAAGVADGLNFGHNARAALITRGLAEISRLGVSMGANPLTFAGLAGLGDLVLTCTGDLSRNRTVGLKIAQGMKLKEIVAEVNTVAEGVRTCLSAVQLGEKMGVELPITAQVYEVLYKRKDPRKALRDVMTRNLKAELD